MDATRQEIDRLSAWLMTTLKKHPKMDDVYQATVNFSCYSSLFGLITDLMKLCALAHMSEEPHMSPILEKGPIDLAGIMELAIQLMPGDEGELLDNIREITEQEDTAVAIIPEYNYSSVRIV